MISFSFISLLLFAQFTLVTFKGYQVVVLAEVVFNLIMYASMLPRGFPPVPIQHI
jgi:hypothetical protein